MDDKTPVPDVDRDQLREAVRGEYCEVAKTPGKGFHFHTGRKLAAICEYRDEWLEGIPERVIERFAGTGNPFNVGPIEEGERVVDLGCGAGIDSFVAARRVGPDGAVIGVDMTPEMLEQADVARDELQLAHLEFRQGYLEELPIEDGWADVVISNGSTNLAPDKLQVYREMHRVLKPGGRLQMADILVDRPVSDEAKRKIDLWTG
jgi:SAM-dependent methyltransferase